MKLEFFRIRDCFGFVDSGEINLRDPKNMTYFLGRNSSGKSSVLRALEHFAYGIRPDQHSKFRNFDPPRDEPVLEAEFSISGGELPVRPVVEHVANAFRPMPVQITETNNGRFIAPDEPRVNAVLEVVQDGYETLLAEIERVGRVRIEKEHDGEYKFHIPSAGGDRTLYRMRRGAIEDALNRGRQQGTGRWVVSSNSYAFTLNRFADIEGVLARQLPDIFLFERRFALRGSLAKGQTPPQHYVLPTFIAKTGQGSPPQCLAERLSGPVESFQNSL